ncbi:glycosyltransferase [Paenibacillus yanchengensis]|uniref:Glycosyltransferase n=1 Tax=Paenibacillus yanchengensis TaxID=2035833 RepID=A0ABW4YFK5_9BACL
MTNSMPKVTLSMIVRNEANRHLRQALTNHRQFIDQAVIIDDGSNDHTVAMCKEVLHDIPLKLICNPHSTFHHEVDLRKQQWQETIATNPEWILNLDADEWFENNDGHALKLFLQSTSSDAIYFRLFDMWNNTHYRDDHYWRAHHLYRPFLVRYKPNIDYIWKESDQHSGRFPLSISDFPYHLHQLRIQHFGWAREADRQTKFQRYMELDGDGKDGWLEQYHSILDATPNLIPFD